jgi:hypothetical protein
VPRNALWRITGDPTEAVPPLIAAVRPVTQGRPRGRETTLAVNRLGETGPPAAEAAPLLKQILSADHRPVTPGQWRSIPDDHTLRGAITTALEHIIPAADLRLTDPHVMEN